MLTKKIHSPCNVRRAQSALFCQCFYHQLRSGSAEEDRPRKWMHTFIMSTKPHFILQCHDLIEINGPLTDEKPEKEMQSWRYNRIASIKICSESSSNIREVYRHYCFLKRVCSFDFPPCKNSQGHMAASISWITEIHVMSRRNQSVYRAEVCKSARITSTQAQRKLIWVSMRSFAEYTKVVENCTKLDLMSQTAKKTIRLNETLKSDLTVDFLPCL